MQNEKIEILINDWGHQITGRDDQPLTKFKKSLPSNLAWLSATLFISILMLFSVVVRESLQGDVVMRTQKTIPYPLSTHPLPLISAHAYLIKVLGSDLALAKQREWKKMPPASLTKLLTAVIAKDNLATDEKIILSEESKKTEEKTSGIPAGEKFWRDDMLTLAIMASANDAALALAEKVGEEGGKLDFQEKINYFTELMQKKAHEIGLENSSFKNPSGLDAKNHYASAEDLTRLAEHIWYNHPQIWAVSRTFEKSIVSDSGREYKIVNTNELLKEFPAILGGKTGLTDNAKGTLILLYPLKTGDIAVTIILGSEDRFGDGRKIIQWLESLEIRK